MRLIDADFVTQWAKIFCPNNKQLISAIENAPTVDTVTHGQWIRLKDEKGKLFPWYQCSKCDSSPAEYGDKLPPYCHCCGAKMAEVEL